MSAWDLAIETSHRPSAVALSPVADSAAPDAPPVVHVAELDRGQRHQVELAVAIDQLLKSHDARPEDLRAIHTCIGPGSFTGLRVAVAAAAMIGRAAGTALTAVSALEAIATADLAADPPASPLRQLIAILPRRDAFYGCLHDTAGDDAEFPVGRLGALKELRGDTAPDRLITDQSDHEQVLALRETLPDLTVKSVAITAEAVLACGRRALAAGRTVEPDQLGPIYPRPPEAVTLWRQRHGE